MSEGGHTGTPGRAPSPYVTEIKSAAAHIHLAKRPAVAM